ncbi:PEGA domain-containing protein, partial [Natronoglomus mannanivorans]|nr:PEGA domain-containing protein [Halobacteria archaeon AArc-xg1-1]
FDSTATAEQYQQSPTEERERFHDDLERIHQNTVNIQNTDDDGVLSGYFEQRKEYLKELYQTMVRFERSILNGLEEEAWYYELGIEPSGVLGWMFEYWEVTDEDFYLVEGQFEQLKGVLIADYYYTQMYLTELHPDDHNYDNLASVAGGEEPDYPVPNVLDVSKPDTVVAGDDIEIEIEVLNDGVTADYQTIALSLASHVDVETFEIVDHDMADPTFDDVVQPGETMGGRYGREDITIDNVVAEVGGEWDSGKTHTLTVRVVPADAGECTFYVKSVAQRGGWNSDPALADDTSSNVSIDQQEEAVYSHSVEVVSKESLNVEVSPDGADIELDGEHVGTTPWSNDLSPLESYTVTVDSDGYEPRTYDGVSPPGTIDDTLNPEDAELSVDSTPDGATVIVDGDDVGVTPWSGELPITDTYEVRIEKDGYEPRTYENVSLPETIDTELDSEDAELSVDSTPDGATVTVDGDDVGTTPWSGNLPTTATYEVRIEKDGYEPRTYENVSPPETIDKNLKLEVAELSVDSTPDGATVTVGGDDVGTTPWSGELPVTDTYEVRIEKDGYESKIHENVSLPDSIDTELEPEVKCVSIPEAIDEDADGTIDDSDISRAIEYWRDKEEVPGTCGETIDDSTILELIERWRNGGSY